MIELLSTETRQSRSLGRRAWVLPLLGATLAFWASPARAQTSAAAYFPSGNFGYDQDLGVTVLSRARPEYDQSGVQLGGFTVRPQLDQSIFDNSNVNGTGGSNSGSWGSETSGSVTGASDWSRNSLQASLGFDHYSYFAMPTEDYTNWNIDIGGGYTIAGGQLRANYAHSTYNQLGTEIGTAQSESPSQNTTDTGNVSYDFNLGRVTISPSVDYSVYRLGDITMNGVKTSQATFDRNVVAAGVVTRYALSGGTGLLLVTRGTSTNYVNPVPDQLSNNSVSGMVLAGIEYQPEAVWRYSFLVGVETRVFSASQYGTFTAPVLSGQVIWTPKPVLTLAGNLTRTIEDADTSGNNGYVLNDLRIACDYELMRNVLLEGRVDLQYASYLQGGTQTNETAGAGVTWLLNRRVRLSLDDDYTNQSSPGTTTTPVTALGPDQLSGAYRQNLLMLTLHLAL